MRLDKFLSHSTGLSRADIKKLIKAGDVMVNDRLVSNPAMAVGDDDEVILDGADITAPQPRYFMLHKPAGYICATKDSNYPTVIDLIYEARPDKLQIAGRLDVDSTGLVLITDDGNWNHRLTSPKSDCLKLYRVALDRPVEPHYSEKLAAGVWLNNEKRRCLPAELRIIDDHSVELAIQEGKYHQVKRMFAALGNHVNHLHRISVGKIQLDDNLAIGDYRALTHQEIDSI